MEVLQDSIGRLQTTTKRHDYSQDSTMYFNKLPEPIPFEQYLTESFFLPIDPIDTGSPRERPVNITRRFKRIKASAL
jgi:hypothetical protein